MNTDNNPAMDAPQPSLNASHLLHVLVVLVARIRTVTTRVTNLTLSEEIISMPQWIVHPPGQVPKFVMAPTIDPNEPKLNWSTECESSVIVQSSVIVLHVVLFILLALLGTGNGIISHKVFFRTIQLSPIIHTSARTKTGVFVFDVVIDAVPTDEHARGIDSTLGCLEASQPVGSKNYFLGRHACAGRDKPTVPERSHAEPGMGCDN